MPGILRRLLIPELTDYKSTEPKRFKSFSVSVNRQYPISFGERTLSERLLTKDDDERLTTSLTKKWLYVADKNKTKDVIKEISSFEQHLPAQVIQEKLGKAFGGEETVNISQPKGSKLDETERRIHRLLKGRIQEAEVDHIVENIEHQLGQDESDLSLKEVEKLANSKWLLFPQSKWKLRWDCLIFTIVIIFVGIMEPYLETFTTNSRRLQMLMFTEIIFILDIAVTFSTCVVDPRGKKTIIERTSIAKKYLKFWLLVDIIAFFPTFACIFGRGSEELFWQPFRFLRFTKIVRILDNVSKTPSISPSHIAAVYKVVYISMFFHWTACAYCYVGDESQYVASSFFYMLSESHISQYEENVEFDGVLEFKDFEEANTDNSANDDEMSPLDKYFVSFFWSVTATTGIGRDIRPSTSLEYMFAILMIVMGFGVYAYIIGGVTNSLNVAENDARLLRRKLQTINSFLKKQKHIHPILQERLKDWYMYSYSRKGIGSLIFENKFEDLHDSLKLELKLLLRMPIVKSVPLFSFIDNSMCTIDIIERLKPQLMIPEEIIFFENEESDGLYILTEGNVEVRRTCKETDTQIALLSPPCVFGEISLLFKKPRNSTVAVLTHAEALKLEKPDFEDIMQRYPKFFMAMKNMTNMKAEIGWHRIRTMIKVSRTARLWSVQGISMKDILGLGNKKEVPPNSMLSRDRLFENNNHIYQHYVYKNWQKRQEAQRKLMLQRRMERNKPKLYRRGVIIARERQEQSLSKILESKSHLSEEG